MENWYFECENCQQVVQGFHASESVECCEDKQMVEIDPPEEEDTDDE